VPRRSCDLRCSYLDPDRSQINIGSYSPRGYVRVAPSTLIHMVSATRILFDHPYICQDSSARQGHKGDRSVLTYEQEDSIFQSTQAVRVPDPKVAHLWQDEPPASTFGPSYATGTLGRHGSCDSSSSSLTLASSRRGMFCYESSA
jgi:hypothetical protein